MIDTSDPDPFCTLKEAEQILKSDRRTVKKWLEAGLLQGYKRPDGRILVLRRSIDECLRQLDPGKE